MSRPYAVDAPFPERNELGEGPLWDPATGRLSYVDIDGGAIHDLDPSTGALHTIQLTPPISFAVPVAGTAVRICGTGGELIAVDIDGRELGRHQVEIGKTGNRMNEGKVDGRGRLWFGSMSYTREPEASALYRLDERGVQTIADRITLSNGTDWDVERERMYYVDSTTQRIDVWDYDVDSGSVTDRRPWVTIEAADGLPDGLTVDADGCVWVCLFGGAVVRRYDPDGALMVSIPVPVTGPTSAAFGGADLSTLFVTTSRHRLDADERREQPLAGAILTIDAGVSGRPANGVDRRFLDALGLG